MLPDVQEILEALPAAARWALGALPERWHSLIQQAAAWSYDTGAIGRIEDIQALIRYTLAQAKAF
jgi:hypothetical protein